MTEHCYVCYIEPMQASFSVIDAWAQIFTTPEAIPPEVQRLFQHSGTSHLLKTGIQPAQVVEMMDAAGIEKLLVCAWCRPNAWLVTNDEVADYVEQFPDRFIGVAAVDLQRPLLAVRELDRAVRELGFKALRVIPWLWNTPPNDKLYYPLYVKCIELGIPFCTQVGHTGPLMPSEPGRPIPYLDEVALTFPELHIVGGHIGYPWTEEMIGLAWKHEHVYIDTSAWAPRYYPKTLIHFIKNHGQDKVLFGTNFPQLPFERCVQEALNLDLTPSVAEKFFVKNAKKVFQL